MVFVKAGNPCKTPQEVLNSITPSGNFALSDHGSKKDNFFCFLQIHSLFCHWYSILCVKQLFLRCSFCRNIYDSSFSNIPEGELNKLKNLSIM